MQLWAFSHICALFLKTHMYVHMYVYRYVWRRRRKLEWTLLFSPAVTTHRCMPEGKYTDKMSSIPANDQLGYRSLENFISSNGLFPSPVSVFIGQGRPPKFQIYASHGAKDHDCWSSVGVLKLLSSPKFSNSWFGIQFLVLF